MSHSTLAALAGGAIVSFAPSSIAVAAGDAPGSVPVPVQRTYRVEQKVTLDGIAEGAQKVRWWIAIPDSDRDQELLDLAVRDAPGPWRIERESEHGNRFLYVTVENPGKSSLEATIEFTATRSSSWVGIDPTRVGPLSAGLQSKFAAELRRDAPHMEVTEEIERTANRVCGGETNIAIQSRQLLDYVADFADHYSKDATKPKCGVGDAGACILNEGGCCTDLHSLFIALARARGIPARLQMGYRLQEKNLGKVVDPGYRCWAEYFVPGYGWVPADIVEADAADGLGRDRWFTGLTERRVHLNEGRDFVLSPAPDAPGRINTMVIGYAEVDGVPARLLPEGELAAQLTRTVRCVEVDAAEPALVRN